MNPRSPMAPSGRAPARRAFLTLACGLAADVALGLTAGAPRAQSQSQAPATAAPSGVMAADEAYEKAKAGEITLIDIRTPQEWAETGVPEGALAIDMTQQDNFIQSLIALRMADANKPIALICRTGNRSGYVVKVLAEQGFPGLVDVSEGVAGGPNGTGWKPRGLPLYPGTPDEINARLEKSMP